MKIISAEQVHQHLNFEELIPLLKQSFSRPFSMPQRQVHELDAEQTMMLLLYCLLGTKK